MSKVAQQITMNEAEERALFSGCSNISEDEAFEILEADGINFITWSPALNRKYALWQYFTLK